VAVLATKPACKRKTEANPLGIDRENLVRGGTNKNGKKWGKKEKLKARLY